MQKSHRRASTRSVGSDFLESGYGREATLLQRVRGRRGHRGQSVVEFALVLPVLILILLVVIDFGRVFYTWVNLTSAARVGAAYAAAHPTESFGPGSGYATAILADRNDLGCPLSPTPAPPAPSFGLDTSPGSFVTVTLGCDFRPATPFIGAIVGNSVRVTAGAVYTIRAGVVSSNPSPAPTPSPSPTPTAEPTCTVPNLIGLIENTTGLAAWTGAGFLSSNYQSSGPPGFTIQAQTLVSDTIVVCSSNIMVKPR